MPARYASPHRARMTQGQKHSLIFNAEAPRPEALEILRGRDASHKKHGTGMGESMWAQLCADIENDSSAEREISATQWHSHGLLRVVVACGEKSFKSVQILQIF